MLGLKFADALSAAQAELLQCPVCLDVLSDPVLVCTGEHHLCRKCADGLRTNKCPVCRKKVKKSNPQRLVKNSLAKLRVHCPNKERGCDAVLFHPDMTAHLAVCPNEEVKCQHCEIMMERLQLSLRHHHCKAVRFGCDFVAEGEEAIAAHQSECAVAKCSKQFESYDQQIAELKQEQSSLKRKVSTMQNSLKKKPAAAADHSSLRRRVTELEQLQDGSMPFFRIFG